MAKSQQFICSKVQLDTDNYRVCNIRYRMNPTSAIIFKYDGSVYAYVNHCVHMHRRLDCQEDAIFDPAGNLLRCSMHGFVFEPTSGECLSPVCAGQKLQPLKIIELKGEFFFADKHVRLMD